MGSLCDPSLDRTEREMAGAGFEPAKAVPRDLQSRPFDRSGTPPGVSILGSWGAQRPRHRRQTERIRVDLERRVPRSTQIDPGATPDLGRRDIPPPPVSDQHEEIVVSRRVEPLDEAAPALVAPPRANGDAPPVSEHIAARLHLNTRQTAPEISDQIEIRAVANRDEDSGTLTKQPCNRRPLTRIALLPRRPLTDHAQNICSPPDRTAPKKRPAAAAPRAAPRASSACDSRSAGSARASR